MAAPTPKRRIVFVHPDLGIGGAERLIIDAAVGLQSLGHKVTIFTSYRDVNHCFDEARDGTLDVRVRGDRFVPQTIFGRFSILCSILRQIALVFSIRVLSKELDRLKPDIFVVDQLSVCVPLFRGLQPKAKILFYGHYPDRLLVQQETGTTKHAKKLYRVPFDALEGWSTACADSIVVNSKYTRSVFKQTFTSLRSRELKVVYPCVNTKDSKESAERADFFPGKQLLLSINRFEGKKDLDLAINAFAGLSTNDRSKAVLVLAGGYDPRNRENASVHTKLKSLCDSLDLKHATFRSQDTLTTDMVSDDAEVLFLLSISSQLKQNLLNAASLLIYTPTNEHFGIVPLEAMLAGVPVLATNTGGPLETVYDGRTGWLRAPDKVSQWTDVMRKPLIPSSAKTLQEMGQKGRERVLKEFSETTLAEMLDQEINRLVTGRGPRPEIMSRVTAMLIIFIAVAFYGVFIAGIVTLVDKYGLASRLDLTGQEPEIWRFNGVV